MSRAIAYREYYIDRLREADLIADFPGDEVLINGLYAMQTHMWNNGVNIEIPIVRVMNTAHFLAAYMFATTCSGDQTEYDAMASMCLGRDKQLFKVAIIVLAAMLARTEGFRARNCRNLILDNRDPDFDEGVLLYDRFLRSAEKRFIEEDFLIDTQQLISRINEQDQIITQQASTIQQLKYTITTMENQQNNQYNNCVILNAPVFNTNTTNNHNYYQQPYEAPKTEPVREDTPIDQFKYIHVNVTDEKEREQIHKTVYNIVRLPKMQQVCDELYKLMKDTKVLCTINPDSMLVELRRMGLPDKDINGFSDKNFAHYYRTPKLA